MAIKDSMILQLLDPEAARRLAEQEQRNQQMAMAQSRSPLLAEAAKTAGMFSSALGGALGRDMRSPMEKRAQNVQAAMATSGGNLIEAAKILQQSDPAAAMLLMERGRAMQPKLTQREVPMGYRTVQSVNAYGMPETKTVMVKKLGAFDEAGNLVGFYEEGGLRRISPEEAKQIQQAQDASAQSTGVMKNDIEPEKFGKGTFYRSAGMGTGVQQGAPIVTVPPETQERMEQQSGASRTARGGQQPSLSQLIAEAGKGGARAPTVATMQGVPPRPTITGQPIEPPAPSRTVQTSAEAGAEMQALQQADTKTLTKRLAELKAIPIMSADQQEEYRRIVAALGERAKTKRASR